ncbi:Non-specific lipid-transfer protein [Linum grandiflorum]
MAASAMKLVAVLLVCAMVAAAPAGAITCGQVANNMAPCINYLKSGGTVPPACCNGIKTTLSQARTTADRRQACQCLKSAAAGISGLNEANAANMPAACRVNIPYKISTSTNCNTVQ